MAVPTLYEWAGGAEALERLTERFYGKVKADPLLEPLFAAMPPDHPHHVALWLGEVFRYRPESNNVERNAELLLRVFLPTLRAELELRAPEKITPHHRHTL